MFKIYNIKGNEIPIVDVTTEDEYGCLYSTLGLVCIELSTHQDITLERVLEKKSDLIISAYNGTNKQVVQRSDEEFEELVFKYFDKYEKILGLEAKKLYIYPSSLKSLAWAYNDNEIELNHYMKYLEEEIIELTIYHELCHLYTLKHYGTFEHDEDFYNMLYKEFPKEEVERIMSNN
ncbi:MAG: M48 family metallopeptidase [Methanosphaera sp.]|nr:M48 family metallopeptidase [Methanosphaera sp.]